MLNDLLIKSQNQASSTSTGAPATKNDTMGSIEAEAEEYSGRTALCMTGAEEISGSLAVKVEESGVVATVEDVAVEIDFFLMTFLTFFREGFLRLSIAGKLIGTLLTTGSERSLLRSQAAGSNVKSCEGEDECSEIITLVLSLIIDVSAAINSEWSDVGTGGKSFGRMKERAASVSEC